MKIQLPWHKITGAALITGGMFAAHGQPMAPPMRQPMDREMYIQDRAWYFRAGVGPAFMQDTGISVDRSVPDANVKFEPGVRFDFAGGYRFNPYFSLEGNVGVVYNRLDSISGSPNTEADLTQVPIMGNAVLEFPNRSQLTPFISGGIGVSATELHIHDATIQGFELSGRDSTAVFAYQAAGGFRYDFNPWMGISVAYEFLGTTSPEWNVSGTPNNMILRRPYTHSIVAAFVMRF